MDPEWALLVSDKPRKKSWRPSRDDRVIFNGLIWMARTSTPSQMRRYRVIKCWLWHTEGDAIFRFTAEDSG